jgi:phosphoribosyl 1,2-cyclic phosphate phosphodiesterase
MTIRLLGTGAADGIPGLFSADRVSNYARQHGGKDVRTRTGALIDGLIKIDLPPDTLMQLQRDRLSAADWCALVFTHSHDDHFAPTELQYCLYPFTDAECAHFTIYGNGEICRRIAELYPKWPYELIETRSFESVTHADYKITPVKANHKPDEDSHNLVFERDGKRLLYATDTGVWEEETWEFLQDVRLDLLVIECTDGFSYTDYYGHLDIALCKEVVERLRKMGTLSDSSKVLTTHHSHNGQATHNELVAAFSDCGIEPAYDGLEIAI